jgi:hypothetical protein
LTPGPLFDTMGPMIDNEQQKGQITSALKLIAKILGKDEMDARSYGAYRLRRARYRLLTNSGCAAHMTYPKTDQEMQIKHVKPVRINRHGGSSIGSRGATVNTEAILGHRMVH